MSGSKKLEIKKKIEDESRQKGEKIDQLTLPMSERKKKKRFTSQSPGFCLLSAELWNVMTEEF